MAVLKETIVGTKIYNEISSSNLRKTIYDTETKSLVVEFNNGLRYEYHGVPHQIYTRMRLSQSQGKYFMTEIAKKYGHTKLT